MVLTEAKAGFAAAMTNEFRQGDAIAQRHKVEGTNYDLGHGDVVIAAITSCTNTSNPSVMMAAGLLARNAVAKGLTVKPWVKTSLAPGSQVVEDYFKEADLQKPLDKLGFNIVGFGCTTCIGNSGPLAPEISTAIAKHNLVAAAVLSGNRNFEGRVNPDVRANYLASPPLVVAYALAGSMQIDLTRDPLGADKQGKPVYLADIWPKTEEVQDYVEKTVSAKMFKTEYASVFDGDSNWRKVKAPSGQTYAWDIGSTYVQEPPYFEGLTKTPVPVADIENARILALFLNSITTDHISPAGSIKAASPAGQYLIEHQVRPVDFNQYGTRRGNHEVMMRGTFANIRIKNQMVKDDAGVVIEGGFTVMQPSGERLPIYDAAMRYEAEKVPLVVFAGREYGTGSSRDWAAKGTKLLGVRAVIAQSFERIHRSNLVGMGVLPLVFEEGTSWQTLGLKGDETVTIHGLGETLKPRQMLRRRDRQRRRGEEERAAHLPHRYAGRARIFPQRRDSGLRAAAARGLGGSHFRRPRPGSLQSFVVSSQTVRPPLPSNLFHHVLRAARPVAALAVPETDEVDLVRAEAHGRVQHPAIVALVSVLSLSRRAKLERRHMQRRSRFGGEEPRAPVAVGEVDRLLEKGRLFEGDVNFEQAQIARARLRRTKDRRRRRRRKCKDHQARRGGPPGRRDALARRSAPCPAESAASRGRGRRSCGR